MNSKSDNDDAGAPMPDFRASNIQLQTIAPALGVPSLQPSSGGGVRPHRPDYLEYDINPHGRGFVVTMFANTGLSYMIGIGAGGIYGVRHGFRVTPSQRFRVQLNSILNHTGRYGSRVGNAFGTVAMLYSFYEWGFDRVCIISRRWCVFWPTQSNIYSYLSFSLS
jgi:Tim17/Tim22/Tim23/Pmp24 family